MKKLEERPPFETTTKAEGSKNMMLEVRIKTAEFLEGRKKALNKEANLAKLEQDAMNIIDSESVVNMSVEMVEAVRRVFLNSKLRGEEEKDDVEVEEFFYNIVNDKYLEKRIETVVRESTDGDRETLDNLLARISKDHFNEESRISWEQFIVFFCKRGKLREGEQLQFSGVTVAEIDTVRAETQRFEDEEPESLRMRLLMALKEMLVGKQNRVLKGGKGKYNVTVPAPFDFMKRPRQAKTIRQEWLEAEAARKEKQTEKILAHKFKANEIPRSTLKPLYQKILTKNEQRRQEIREASMAKTKQTEKPFSFYERDLQKARDQVNLDDEIDTNVLNQFRARIVPWRILIPKFRMMCEKDEHEREQRIRSNAEKSYQMAKLPPRMQQHEDEKRRRIEEDLDSTQRSVSTDIQYSFRPPRARSVPNFKQLQKSFVTKMEQLKKGKAPTIPKPFNFHQPKPAAHLRKFMDEQNQAINPTLKSTTKRPRSVMGGRDQNVEQPATTRKHEAYVALVRSKMEERKLEQEKKFQSEIERFIKQNRLQQRVKCSPALVSNSNSLKQKRIASKSMARKRMAALNKQYENIKSEIEFKVANRPLLVEQVSKAFIHNLGQIKEL